MQRALKALTDEMMDRYLDWREACSLVDDSYRRWAAATGDGAMPAHAAYLGALDQEESAASAYAEAVERVKSRRELRFAA